jgi:hypothetical protein
MRKRHLTQADSVVRVELREDRRDHGAIMLRAGLQLARYNGRRPRWLLALPESRAQPRQLGLRGETLRVARKLTISTRRSFSS